MQVITESFSELLVVHYRAGHADDGKIIRQQIAFLEMVKRGDQLSLGQIAGRAKDHQHARWRSVLFGCFGGLRPGFPGWRHS